MRHIVISGLKIFIMCALVDIVDKFSVIFFFYDDNSSLHVAEVYICCLFYLVSEIVTIQVHELVIKLLALFCVCQYFLIKVICSIWYSFNKWNRFNCIDIRAIYGLEASICL